MPEVNRDRFLELTQDLQCAIDRDGHITYANSRLAGLRDSSLENLPFSDLLHPDDVPATHEALTQLTPDSSTAHFANRVRDSEQGNHRVSWSARLDEEGSLVYLVGRITDDEDRALLQEVERAEQRLDDSQRIAGIGSWELDLQKGGLWWSKETYRIFEIGPSEFSGKFEAFVSLIHPEDREGVVRSYEVSVQEKTPYEFECRLLMGDGRIKFVREQGQTTYSDDGKPLRSFGTVWEVTDARTAEINLAESNTRFEAALEGVATGFFILDRQWHYHFINSIGAQMVNRTREELKGKVIWEEFPEAIDSGYYKIYHRVMDSRQPEVLEEYYPQLDTWFEVHVYPYVDGISVFFLDTTKRKQVEQELLRKQAAIASAVDGVLIAEPSGRISYVNPALVELWGSTGEKQFVGSTIEALWPTARDADRVLSEIRSTGLWSGELPIARSDGESRILQVGAGLILDEEMKADGIVMSFADITANRRYEAELELKDRAMMTSLSGVVVTDAEGRLVFHNPSFLRLLGYSEGDPEIQEPFEQIAEAEKASAIMDAIREQGSWQGESVARKKQGTTFEIFVSASGLRDKDGSVANLVVSIADISESKQLEAQFLQAQKMESVGRLAGGVAHDFNNLLTIILGNVEIVRLKLEPEHPAFEYLSHIEDAGKSASMVTQQLLAFSRRQLIDPKVVNLNDIVERVRMMLIRLIGEDIRLQTRLSSDMSNVVFDPSQFEQILINLAVNARDAMPDGGEITIETTDVTLGQEYADSHPDVAPGSYVMVAVSDNGQGMDQEVKDHLFEPFYTTKERGKGTGLGLAMVYGAVSQNGGRIEVYSELKHGTTFKIYLPSVDRRAVEPDKEESLVSSQRGTERILVVEDDEGVREFARNLLVLLGYSVSTCNDGTEALQFLQETNQPYDLVITDVIMPNMNGKVLSERVHELNPSTKVLFTSGYTQNATVHHGILSEGVEFLPKPYSPAALARRVRDVLAPGKN